MGTIKINFLIASFWELKRILRVKGLAYNTYHMEMLTKCET